MASSDPSESSDYTAFAILVYEFRQDEMAETDRKIRRTLGRKHLGPYVPARIARLRALKNDLQRELRSGSASAFYKGPTSQFASPDDFDQVALVEDLARRFPEVDRGDLYRMVSIALYVNYLR